MATKKPVRTVSETKGSPKPVPAAMPPKPAAAPAPAAKPAKAPAIVPVVKLTHDLIAAKAYEIWVKKGRPHGQDAQNWAEAEKQLAKK